MINKYIFYFLIIGNFLFGADNLKINFERNEPILGSEYYVEINNFSQGFYKNATGYSQSVKVEGEPLRLEPNLKSIKIDFNGQEYNFDVNVSQNKEEYIKIDFKGVIIDFKWRCEDENSVFIKIDQWDLEKKDINFKMTYVYEDEEKSQNINIFIPRLNPKIYFYEKINKNILVKKRKYKENIILLKELRLKDYDYSIFSKFNFFNDENIEVIGKNYKEKGRILYLEKIEKNIYKEITNGNIQDYINKNIFLGLEIPKDLKPAEDYVAQGNILSLAYNDKIEKLLNKVILLKVEYPEIKRKIILTKEFNNREEININNFSRKNKNYIFFEKNIKKEKIFDKILLLRYKNKNVFKFIVDKNGNSKEKYFDNFSIKVIHGDIIVKLQKSFFKKSFYLNFDILNKENELEKTLLLNFKRENIYIIE